MAVKGVQNYAKCLGCGDVSYTDVSDSDQAVICPCKGTWVKNGQVFGAVDPNFTDQDMEEWLLQSTQQT